jgi:hypothetical protein
MYKFEIIVFFVLLVFGLSLFASFIYSGGDVLASIYPELIGFSFEGIFLVVLLTWLQRRKDNESEIKKKDNLKQYFGQF